jgi:hypothetical protein
MVMLRTSMFAGTFRGSRELPFIACRNHVIPHDMKKRKDVKKKRRELQKARYHIV